MAIMQDDAAPGRLGAFISRIEKVLARTPQDLVAIMARLSMAAVFWRSGQTKIQGFKLDLVEGRFEFGIPRFADSTVDLFRDEYKLPVIPPELAALMATAAEHLFPALILLGLFTRFSALALLIMTLTIQIFVYSSAWIVHAGWAAALLFLVKYGPGRLSLDPLWRGRA